MWAVRLLGYWSSIHFVDVGSGLRENLLYFAGMNGEIEGLRGRMEVGCVVVTSRISVCKSRVFLARLSSLLPSNYCQFS